MGTQLDGSALLARVLYAVKDLHGFEWSVFCAIESSNSVQGGEPPHGLISNTTDRDAPLVAP